MTIRIMRGDCRDILKQLPDNSVHMVCTSPPYYGLRDYGTAEWDGGDAACDHRAGSIYGSKSDTNAGAIRGGPFRDTCGKCGARRIDRQIGLEQSPSEYVATMVEVFREVWRVLRDDGTLWLNLGDSYAASPAGNKVPSGISQTRPQRLAAPLQAYNTQARSYGAAKPKDLMMMPACVALALQADGWTLRSQMPWVKRSCMPESVEDRPTSAIEYVYLLTKGVRYFYDAEAIRRVGTLPAGTKGGKASVDRSIVVLVNSRPPEYVVYSGTRSFRNSDLFFESLDGAHGVITDAAGEIVALDVNTAGFKESHFAVFPPGLVEPLIKCGTSERGCCRQCGAPWVRQVERIDTGTKQKAADGWDTAPGGHDGTIHRAGREKGQSGAPVMANKTAGWLPSCSCNAGEPVPCTVLDPFGGAGTTGLVADRLQRHAILIELNPEYAAMAERRIRGDAGLFAEVG